MDDEINLALDTPDKIDNAVKKLSEFILKAKELAVTYVVKKSTLFKIFPATRACIRIRNSTNRKWHRCENSSEKTTRKSIVNLLKNKSKRKLDQNSLKLAR